MSVVELKRFEPEDRVIRVTYTDKSFRDIVVYAKFFRSAKARDRQINNFITHVDNVQSTNYLIKVQTYFKYDDYSVINYLSTDHLRSVDVYTAEAYQALFEKPTVEQPKVEEVVQRKPRTKKK